MQRDFAQQIAGQLPNRNMPVRNLIQDAFGSHTHLFAPPIRIGEYKNSKYRKYENGRYGSECEASDRKKDASPRIVLVATRHAATSAIRIWRNDAAFHQ